MSTGSIVLVPGFAGCELVTPPSFFGLGPPLKVWLNYAGLPAGMWRWLKLKADGRTPDFPGVGAINPRGPLGSYYGTISVQLAARGWRVIGAQLDWRELLALDGQRLAETIIATAVDGPVNLVAHSRGGLVTRVALSILSQSGQLGKVSRVVGLGVPHSGTWEAAGLLSGWQMWSRLVRNLLEAVPGSLAGDLLFGGWQDVVTTWPAIYQLLPAPFASGVSPDALSALYDPAQWAAVGHPVSAAWLDVAHQTWPALPPSPVSVPWLDVIGTGFSTAIYPRLPHPPAKSTDLVYSTAGDGVVPAAWAVQAGRAQYAARVDHSALVVDGRVLSAVDGWLRAASSTAPSVGQPAAINPRGPRRAFAQRRPGRTGRVGVGGAGGG